MPDTNLPTEVTFRIRRMDASTGEAPHWEDYRLPYSAGMTVLEGLKAIKEKFSPSLAWRSSCRMGVCGSCGMFINGRPRLACNTQVSELGGSLVTVAPLPNFDTIRDLVPDLVPMFEAHRRARPHILRDGVEQEQPTGEYWQSPHQLEEYLQFSYCIKCGCCMAACPTYATDPTYSGPMPLAQAHRYNADTRDEGFKTRKPDLAGARGPWRCHFAGECSRVCPKGVDPAKAIQLMKREMVWDYLHLLKHACGAKARCPRCSTAARRTRPASLCSIRGKRAMD
jgi:succinate dehydrogenase / fumarate reductase iron-sulfur subunit